MDAPSDQTLFDLQTRWARSFIQALAAAGVSDAIVSPGSRSTPFALAALACQAMTCHSIIDERSAGFFALGLSRVSGAPPLLICTSGSAPTHYFPAVVEAATDHLPLIVLSADRPFELQRCGANQTIDQLRLFGEHSRAFVELGAPHATPSSFRALARTARQAVLTSQWPEPGPVHINAPARKPLEPQRVADETEQLEPNELPWQVVAEPSAPDLPEPLLDACARAERPLIVVGAQNPCHDASTAALALADRLGAVLAADAGSALRYSAPERCLGLEVVLRSAEGRASITPDLVLQLGRTPLGSGWLGFLQHLTVPRWVFSQQGFQDPFSNAHGFVLGRVAPSLDKLAAALSSDRTRQGQRSAWCRHVERVASLAGAAISAELGARSSPVSALASVRAVLSSLPVRCSLVLGNSLTIRHADLVGVGTSPRRRAPGDIAVFSQRGASGIDGNVAAAVGIAKKSRRPTLLLTGDVSLAHDVGSLQLAAGLDVPLLVLVLDNGGGQIFQHLPIATLAQKRDGIPALDYFTTPPALDLRGAATLFGCRHTRCTTLDELNRAIRDGWAAGDGWTQPGLTLAEVSLRDPADRDAPDALVAAVAARLAPA